jgi:hypothetical protein
MIENILGNVDGFDNINIIVKNGVFNPQYYKIPRAKVDGYQNGKVLLNISEQDTKRQSRRNTMDISSDTHNNKK